MPQYSFPVYFQRLKTHVVGWLARRSRAPAPPLDAELFRKWLGKMCVIVAGIVALFCVIDSFVVLILLTDPFFRSDLLWLSRSPSWVYMIVIFFFYSILLICTGIILGLVMRKKVPMKKKIVGLLLIIVPGLVFFFVSILVFLIPFARGLITQLPIIGACLLIYSMATMPYPIKSQIGTRFKLAFGFQIALPVANSLIFELTYDAFKIIGILVICSLFTFLGILTVVEGHMAYRLSSRPGTIALDTTRVGDTRPPLTAGRTRPNVLTIITGAVAVLIIIGILGPAIYMVFSPPDAKLYSAEGVLKGKSVSYDVILANHGGRSTGPLELWLESPSGAVRIKLAGIDDLGGFETRRITGEIILPNKTSKYTMVLYHNAAEVDRLPLHIESPCIITWLAAPAALMGGLMPRILWGRNGIRKKV